MELRKSASEQIISLFLGSPEWMSLGNCVGQDIDPLNNEDAEAMKKLCSDCPVLQQCGEKFAEVRQDRSISYGVFHGVNYYEDEDLELNEDSEPKDQEE